MNNYIICDQENKHKTFNPSSDYLILEEARRENSQIFIDNKDEASVLSKIINFSNFMKDCNDKLYKQKEEKLAESKFFYE